ncbi:SDR family NAD(P)-dependent oxidoreductase [Variovorax sp. E3]|uniref:SDR family NAD(P)-dependent oxidoreductase n=1 Tax=Variovorax sp. E3 TaxID=1914993 RepID=UPI0018DBCB2E|nr:SDR family NAD(P)-dependent oxidoreductase [Variovorax sp. E3]
MSTRPLNGRCALVTGSTAGIGLAIADELGKQGADLVLNGFGIDGAIEDLRASLEKRHGVRVTHHQADVSCRVEVQDLVDAAHAHGRGRVDILVNNAGYSIEAPTESFGIEAWDHQVAVNLSAPFHAIRCTLPGMRLRGWGRIVNVASVLGLVAVPNRIGYVATKHALIGLTKVVALETAGTAITCNAVCPGLVGNDRVRESHRKQALETRQSPEEVQRQVMALRQPSGNYIPSEDVAAMVAYLCGPHASEVRGAAWTLDGGWSAR